MTSSLGNGGGGGQSLSEDVRVGHVSKEAKVMQRKEPKQCKRGSGTNSTRTLSFTGLNVSGGQTAPSRGRLCPLWKENVLKKRPSPI